MCENGSKTSLVERPLTRSTENLFKFFRGGGGGGVHKFHKIGTYGVHVGSAV